MKSNWSKLLPICALALLPAAAFADAGSLKFDEETFEVSEDAGVVTIRVERSQGEDGVVSVQYATSNGSALAGEVSMGTLIRPSGPMGSSCSMTISGGALGACHQNGNGRLQPHQSSQPGYHG